MAKNEAFFRQVNERIKDVAEAFEGDHYEFLCECADPSCTERITLSTDQYEAARANATRFVLALGHAAPEIERVVAQEEKHVVIEKVGLAGLIAAQLDPRAVEG